MEFRPRYVIAECLSRGRGGNDYDALPEDASCMHCSDATKVFYASVVQYLHDPGIQISGSVVTRPLGRMVWADLMSPSCFLSHLKNLRYRLFLRRKRIFLTECVQEHFDRADEDYRCQTILYNACLRSVEPRAGIASCRRSDGKRECFPVDHPE